MPGLLSLPYDNGSQARAALGVAANQIARAYDLLAGASGDVSGAVNDLDIVQASTQGLYAMVPDTAVPLSPDLLGKVASALGRTDIVLDEAADVAAVPGARWDFGDALTDLIHDTVATAGDVLGQATTGIAGALSPLLIEILVALAGLVLLVVVLLRNGATLGGLL